MTATDDDTDYFAARAEAEIKAASDADSTAACQAHYRMAEVYLDRLYPPSEREAGEDA